MIIVKIPNNNIFERKYIMTILLHEFLGLNYILEVGSQEYEITLKNSKRLIIKDTFFNKYPNDLEYLQLENIPKNIYELDVFALIFFMLTRWEEYVNKNRDSHGRFPAIESLAYRQGFLDKPIVNEELENLKEQLLELDSSLKFKKREYQLTLTHDVDHLYFWKNSQQLMRIVIGDIIKRKDVKLAFNRVKEYLFVKIGKIQDPFDTFDWIMEQSESIGLKSRFYFMSGGVTQFDNNYKIDEPKALSLIAKIKKRGHYIGIHPSYDAYSNFEQFKEEKELLEKVTNQKIVEGREHYLRFEVPITWQIWEDNGMQIDSTCGYADKEGFRCGTGDDFSVFNILTRKKLNLKERPLIYMDDTSFFYQNFSEEKAYEHIVSLQKENINQYTLLWHQNFNKNDLYLKVINRLKGK